MEGRHMSGFLLLLVASQTLSKAINPNDNESGSFRSLVAGAQFPLPIYNSEA